MQNPKKYVYKATLINVENKVSLEEKIASIESVIEKKLEEYT